MLFRGLTLLSKDLESPLPDFFLIFLSGWKAEYQMSLIRQ